MSRQYSPDHMRKSGVPLHRLYLAVALLLLAVLGTSMWATAPLAKYVTSTSGSDGARVAIFGHDESITVPDDFVSRLQPGDTRTIDLSVANFTDGSTSEVAQQYSIEVVTAGNLPLTFTLTKGGQTMAPTEDPANADTYTFQNSEMTFPAGTERTDTYTLNVSWPENENDYELADLPDYIQINLRVEQMD